MRVRSSLLFAMALATFASCGIRQQTNTSVPSSLPAPTITDSQSDVSVAATESSCPESDKDGDDILDDLDTCPDDPETYNGLDDDDGCPDSVPVAITTHTPRSDNKIYFRNNAANLSVRMLSTIDNVADLMKMQPEILRVGVYGHAADNEGNRKRLSEQRANAVVDALVARGVDPIRLTPYSQGATQPEDPNTSADARARNRRVELIVEN